MKVSYERAVAVASTTTDSQIEVRKKKNVRNYIYVLNSIVTNVLSTVTKSPRRKRH